MASSDRIMGLSKYIVTLPGTTFNVACMIFLSFILGCIVSAIAPSANHSLLYTIYIWWSSRSTYIRFDINNEWCNYTTYDQRP